MALTLFSPVFCFVFITAANNASIRFPSGIRSTGAIPDLQLEMRKMRANRLIGNSIYLIGTAWRQIQTSLLMHCHIDLHH